VVGFKPGQTYQVTLSSGSTPVVSTDTFTPNATNGRRQQLDYDTRGQTIWATVDGVRSDDLVWP